MDTCNVNIGNDCENIIKDYLHQLVETEKYDKMVNQVKETIWHTIDNNKSDIEITTEVIFYKRRIQALKRCFHYERFIIEEGMWCRDVLLVLGCEGNLKTIIEDGVVMEGTFL